MKFSMKLCVAHVPPAVSFLLLAWFGSPMQSLLRLKLPNNAIYDDDIQTFSVIIVYNVLLWQCMKRLIKCI